MKSAIACRFYKRRSNHVMNAMSNQTITQQQRSLESIDGDKRASNSIISGVQVHVPLVENGISTENDEEKEIEYANNNVDSINYDGRYLKNLGMEKGLLPEKSVILLYVLFLTSIALLLNKNNEKLVVGIRASTISKNFRDKKKQMVGDTANTPNITFKLKLLSNPTTYLVECAFSAVTDILTKKERTIEHFCGIDRVSQGRNRSDSLRNFGGHPYGTNYERIEFNMNNYKQQGKKPDRTTTEIVITQYHDKLEG
ncbi:hypothetical protein GQR58_015128 [Nymphon striatum]|nr:hypothetical protein GQR58_015128 [Nymphon striatum]